MSMGLIFWILMLLWAISWPGWGWTNGPYFTHGHTLLLFVLLLLLGWHGFGAPVR